MQGHCFSKTLRICMHVEVGKKSYAVICVLFFLWKHSSISVSHFFARLFLVAALLFERDHRQIILLIFISFYVGVAVNEKDIYRTLIEAIPKLLNWINLFKYPQVCQSLFYRFIIIIFSVCFTPFFIISNFNIYLAFFVVTFESHVLLPGSLNCIYKVLVFVFLFFMQVSYKSRVIVENACR